MIYPVYPPLHPLQPQLNKPTEITKQQLHVAVVNEFYLSPAMRAELKSYYVLHWEKNYLISKLDENGMLEHADVFYVPVFKTALNNPAINRVILSFREPYPICGVKEIPAYVLIKAR